MKIFEVQFKVEFSFNVTDDVKETDERRDVAASEPESDL